MCECLKHGFARWGNLVRRGFRLHPLEEVQVVPSSGGREPRLGKPLWGPEPPFSPSFPGSLAWKRPQRALEEVESSSAAGGGGGPGFPTRGPLRRAVVGRADSRGAGRVGSG